MPLMEEQVIASEEVLTDLLDKLSDMVRGNEIMQKHAELQGRMDDLTERSTPKNHTKQHRTCY